ncbi:hypothetical protein, partial [Thiolapillus sp.]|uniref:hypothetical protein n=1 Tax=Thiolapillus sp. TaxID=2017437 RepID=UPI003AF60E68
MNKRVFGLVIDFGTSQSPKSTRPLTTYLCPSRPGHQALRNNFASSLLLRTWLPYDWTPRSEAYFVFPLAQGTPGKQCGLAATGDYQPSLRSPWLAASDRNNVSLPARTILEMAICECPTAGGHQLSRWKLGELLAKAALLVEVAMDSDAVNSDLIEPRIGLHLNGEYDIDR